jgi:hypothetical protein
MSEPFIGSNYARPDNIFGGARIMILGEAHYSEHHPVGEYFPNLTKEVITSLLAGQLGRKALFFRRVERLLTGCLPKGKAPSAEAIWSSLIFQNFVPVIAGKKPKDRPAPWMWKVQAHDDLRRTVKEKEVEIVLVCGTELWREKPFDIAFPDAYAAAGRTFEAHELTYAETFNALAAHIPHPSGSRGWTYGRCEPAVQFLLRSINGRRRAAEVQLADSAFLD